MTPKCQFVRKTFHARSASARARRETSAEVMVAAAISPILVSAQSRERLNSSSRVADPTRWLRDATGEKFPSRFPRGGNKNSGKGGKAHAMSATGDDAIAPWPNRGELANERDPTFSLGVMLTPAECGYMTRFSCDFIPGVMVVSVWI